MNQHTVLESPHSPGGNCAVFTYIQIPLFAHLAGGHTYIYILSGTTQAEITPSLRQEVLVSALFQIHKGFCLLILGAIFWVSSQLNLFGLRATTTTSKGEPCGCLALNELTVPSLEPATRILTLPR